MKEIPLQKKLNYLGDSGCYLLSLIHQFKQDENVLSLYDYFLNKGFIREDCYVLEPCKILKYLSGNNYKVENVKTLPYHYDFYVEHWFNKKTGYGHFTLHDWDSFGESNTRLNGEIDSYRVFTKLM